MINCFFVEVYIYIFQRGNVAGLENPNDDDPEERASFNGTSTQFM